MTQYLIAVLVTLCAGLSYGGSKPQGAVNPDPRVLNLLYQAKQFMKYEDTVKIPPMLPMTEKQLQKIYCSAGESCTVSALYYGGKVYYNQNLDLSDALSRSIILHEMVHHIQREKVGDTYDCNMWWKKEREAYSIQAAYLRKYGLDDSVVLDTVKILKCPA